LRSNRLRRYGVSLVQRDIGRKVDVGARGSHGSIATLRLPVLPENEREALAGEVHTVMRHDAMFT
jgi:fatty-acyl-CoA synthase